MKKMAEKVKSRRLSVLVVCFAFLLFFFLLNIPQAHTATNVSSDITTDTTWTPAGSPFVVSGEVTVASGTTLTIQDGVVVKMDDNARIIIQGSLASQGLSTNPVTFTSLKDDSVGGDTNNDGSNSTPAPGDWRFLRFEPDSSSILNHTNVSFGGDVGFGAGPEVFVDGGDVTIEGGRYSRSAGENILVSSGTAGISNAEIDEAGEEGVRATREDTVLEINNTSFENNNKSAAHINAEVLFTHSNNTADNNGINGFRIEGEFDQDQTWNPDLPYITFSTSTLIIPSNRTLTIDPGVVVKFANPNSSFFVNGSLITNGTPSNPVVFTSMEDDSVGGDTNNDGNNSDPNPGDWNFLKFEPGSSSTLNHTNVLFGGAGSGFGSGPEVFVDGGELNIVGGRYALSDRENIFISSGTVNISNAEVVNAANEGIRAFGGDTALAVSNTSFEDNAEEAAHIDAEVLFTHFNNSADNNGINGFRMEGAVTEDRTWNADLPYIPTSLTVADGTTLTVEEGATLKFASLSGLVTEGSLVANGTSSNPVTFTSIKDDSVGGDTNNDGSDISPSPGDWQSLRFEPGSSSILNHTNISFGGQTGFSLVPSVIVNDADLTIEGSSIKNSKREALRAGGEEASLTINNSSFENNAEEAVFLDADVLFTHENNFATGNDINGFRIEGEINRDQTWNPDLPYVTFSTSTITVATGTTLNIEPGVIIKPARASSHVNIHGSLISNGTPDNPVTVTSIKDDSVGGDTNNDGSSSSPAPGDWRSLEFKSGSSSTLNHTNVLFGGGVSFFTADPMIFVDGGDLSINGGRYSLGNAENIEVVSGTLSVSDAEIDNADRVGLFVSGGTASINSSSIHDNADFGVRKTDPPTMNAENNWWGDPSGPFHPTLNPDGLGNEVSDNVDFESFLGSDPTSGPVSPQQTLDVAVILVETSDTPHVSSTVTQQPCKLIPEKTYTDGHGSEYFKDLLTCVEDYHIENSLGAVDLNFTIFDKGGDWFKLSTSTVFYAAADGGEAEFVKDAIRESGVDLSGFDMAGIVHSGDAAKTKLERTTHITTQTWPPVGQPLTPPPFQFVVAENNNFVGAWAHEIGHILGEFVIDQPDDTMIFDLYEMGLTGELFGQRKFATTTEGQWDLMAEGSLNEDGKNPPHMSSFTKEFHKWLEEDVHPKSDFGTHTIESLDTAELGDTIFRYNLEDNTSTSTEEYYILEARNGAINTWDSSVPEEEVLVLYKVNTHGFDKYGYNTAGIPFHANWSINIPLFDGVLSPNNESKLDLLELVNITAKSDSFVSGEYSIDVDITDATASQFSTGFKGLILKPDVSLIQKVRDLLPKTLDVQPLPTYPPIEFESDLARVLWVIGHVELKSVGDCCIYHTGMGIYLIVAIIGLLAFLKIFRKRSQVVKKVNDKLKQFFSPTAYKIFIFLGLGAVSWLLSIEFPFPWVIDLGRSQIALGVYADQKITYVFNIVADFFIFYLIACAIVYIIKKWRSKKSLTAVILALALAGGLSATSAVIHENSAKTVKSLGVPITGLTNLPDIDLHAFTPDGRHVGVNYETGEYEVEIPGTETSGDLMGDSEWIFVPEDVEARFVVVARDTESFFDENPDIEAQLSNTTETYDVFARFIDPETDIFTSETLEDQLIDSGQTTTHTITGTSTVEVSETADLTVQADLNFTPKTLNTESKGLLQAFVSLQDPPFDLSIRDITTSTLRLAGIAPEKIRVANNRQLLLDFDRTQFSDLPTSSQSLTITGFFQNGIPLEGSDEIKVIKKGPPSPGPGNSRSGFNLLNTLSNLFGSVYGIIAGLF